MNKTAILIVEDEAIVAADIAGKLALLGYEVVGTAASGAEAIESAYCLRPQLVLMDIHLKGEMDGITAVEEIHRRLDVPVVYLTAHSDSATLERAKLSGPFGYVLKPFDERDLATTVDLALYKHRLDRQMREQHKLLQAQSVQLQMANEELATANEELRAQEEELRAQGEELAASCRELEMAQESLLESHAELENRVAERTCELALTIDKLQEEIDTRKKAENELRASEDIVRRMNRLYAVVSATNHAIVYATDSESIFREFCRVAVELGGFRLAWVGLVDGETGLVNVVAASGVTAYLDGIRISVKPEPEGLGPTGRAVREGTYYICNDFLASDVTRPWHEKAHTHGLYASASIAVKQHGEVIGALTLYAGEKGFFDHQHEQLLLQMGEDVSFALDSIRQAVLRREAEEALRMETAERQRTAEELREKERMLMLQSRQAAMGEMIGNIAHQWRQPLNSLGLMIQSLPIMREMGALDRQSLESMEERAMELIRYMSRTVDDFRNYFKPEKEKVPFRVGEAVSRTVSLVADSFKSRNITVEIHKEGDPVIEGFPNEFSQALLNILMNARDAHLEKGVKDPKVTIRISQSSEKVVVSIIDNAGGILEGFMGKIFDPYFTTKDPERGTGVGLFMSKAIIEKNMSGRLTARNSGGGAEFRIEV